jgi:hypothetical protein
MPLVQEKLWTVELFRDGKLFESWMHDSSCIYLNLSPTRRSGICSYLAMQLDTRFYPSGLELFEDLLINLSLSQGALDDA